MKGYQKICFLFLTAVLLASVSYVYVSNNLFQYSMATNSQLYKEYFVQKLFIFPDYTRLDYMEGKNVFDLMPFYFFLLSAIVVGALSFLSRGKVYFQYYAARLKTSRRLFSRMMQKGTYDLVVFSLSYHMAIICLIVYNTFNYQEDSQTFLLQMVLLLIIHTLFLLALYRFLFFIYLMLDDVRFVLMLVGVLAIIFMINLTFPSLSIIFIWHDLHWVISIIFSGIILLLTQFMTIFMPFHL